MVPEFSNKLNILSSPSPPADRISFKLIKGGAVYRLFLFVLVNGDMASKKSTLLVEDFIKIDVLLVKVCHKRRKVSLAAPMVN